MQTSKTGVCPEYWSLLMVLLLYQLTKENISEQSMEHQEPTTASLVGKGGLRSCPRKPKGSLCALHWFVLREEDRDV